MRLLCNSIYLAQQCIFKEFNEENIKKTKFIKNKSCVNLGYSGNNEDTTKPPKFNNTGVHSATIDDDVSDKSDERNSKFDELLPLFGEDNTNVIDMTRFTKEQITAFYDDMNYESTIFENITHCDITGEEEVDVILSFDASCIHEHEEMDFIKMIGLSLTSQYPNNINIGGFLFGEKMNNISNITHDKLFFENRLLSVDQSDNRHSADGDTLYRALNHCKTILDAQYKLSSRQHIWLFVSECSNDNYYQIQTKKLCETLRSHKYNAKIFCFYLRKSPEEDPFSNFLKSIADLVVIFNDVESMYNYITPPATGCGDMLNPKLYYQFSILIYLYTFINYLFFFITYIKLYKIININFFY